jgi:hypothetical protein
MNKRGQGISMNVIIIAAIALLVLVVLSVVFMGRMGTFSSGSADCNNQGGVCAEVCGTGDAAGHPTTYNAAECPDTKICCIVG